jgi:aconitate hydratase
LPRIDRAPLPGERGRAYIRGPMSKNSFGSQATLQVGPDAYTIYRLDAVYKKYPEAAKLPFSLKILLENLLRTEDGVSVSVEHIEAIAKWQATA